MAPDKAKQLASEYLEKALEMEKRLGYSGKVPNDMKQHAIRRVATELRRLAAAARSTAPN